jgi:DNA-binding response OmpR family regulator
MKILIVEDEIELAKSMYTYLHSGEMICELVHTADEAMDKLNIFRYDIVLLDIMLPDGNGLEILKYLKAQESDAGVLIISAKNSLDDRILGLEVGADDYLIKPFHLSELNARLKAIFRRRKFQGITNIKFEEIEINPDTREVKIDEQLLDLTLKEFELLVYLIANKNRVLTKQNIAEHLWGDNVDFLDSFDFVYQHIKNLRKKISASGGTDYIKTVYGLGYKLSTN